MKRILKMAMLNDLVKTEFTSESPKLPLFFSLCFLKNICRVAVSGILVNVTLIYHPSHSVNQLSFLPVWRYYQITVCSGLHC